MSRVSDIFRSKYLKAVDVQGKIVTARIESVAVEQVGEALRKSSSSIFITTIGVSF
jgi:hypothetical protein